MRSLYTCGRSSDNAEYVRQVEKEIHIQNTGRKYLVRLAVNVFEEKTENLKYSKRERERQTQKQRKIERERSF